MNNYDDPHRKASDDYNNGTIDEKMCPLCGTILPGNVRFCTECGTEQETQKRKKTGANKRSTAVFIALAAVVLAVVAVNLVFYILANKENTKKRFDGTDYGISVNVSDISVPEIPNIDEFSDLTENAAASENYTAEYPDGNYRIGEEIPEGEYLLFHSDIIGVGEDSTGVSRYEINADKNGDINIEGEWFEYSRYVMVEGGGYLDISWCSAYDASLCQVENDPFEHPGMFKVGVDLEAGTYKVKPFYDDMEPFFLVRDNLSDELDIYVDGHYGVIEKDMTVTVEDGQYLELAGGILEKIE